MIAKSKKPHNIGEELVKPAAMAMVKTLGAIDIAKKLESVPLTIPLNVGLILFQKIFYLS